MDQPLDHQMIRHHGRWLGSQLIQWNVRPHEENIELSGEVVMTFRTLLIIKAAVCLVFGTYLLVAPASLLGLLGGSLSGAGLFTGREYGAAMIGTLLLTWFAKDVQAHDARGAILLDLLVYDGIGVIITVSVVVTGVLNALGWGIVLVYAFFTVGSGYLLVKARPFHSRRAA